MSLPTLIHKSLGAVLNSPLLQVFGVGDVYNVLKDHFDLSADEIRRAYQNSYAYALSAIAAGLASPERWQAFWQKLTDSKVEREFASQVVGQYLEPFAQAQGLQGAALEAFRAQAITDCQALAAQKEAVFQIAAFEFTEAELAALMKDTEIATLSELVLAQIQSVPETRALLTDSVGPFLAFQNLLGHALLFFLTEELRSNERFARTLTALRQAGMQDVQEAQLALTARLEQQLTALEQQLATHNQQMTAATTEEAVLKILKQKQGLIAQQQTMTDTLAELPQLLQQAQTACQTTYAEFQQFSERFNDWSVFITAGLETVMAALPALQFVVAKIDQNVEQLLDRQEIILAEIRKLQHWGKRLDVSAQIKPQDGLTQCNASTEAHIREAIAQFKQLPNHLTYPEAALQASSLFAALGDSKAAERFFIDIYQASSSRKYKAIACFNLFQLYVQRGPQSYDKALKSLQSAIRLNRPAHLLHNLERYPFQRLLGAGGMGCVFLCHDTLEEERSDQDSFVVVKCLWDNQPGEAKQIFAEALSMARIAGSSVPKPLDYGFADPTRQKRAYLVTAFIDGALDGEAWLAQRGNLDFITGVHVGIEVAQGLQKAHQKGIWHLDLKPANLLLLAKTSEVSKTSALSNAAISVKIIDFGLAKIATSLTQQAALTQKRSAQSQFVQHIFGTFDYAPPEQWGDPEFRQVSAKSDVFALGKTLYRLFTGFRPQHNFRQKYLPEGSPALHELLEDCVEIDPAARPDIATVLERLQQISKSSPVVEMTEISPHVEMTEISPDVEMTESSSDVEMTEISPDVEMTEISPDIEMTESSKSSPVVEMTTFEVVTVNAKGEITHREQKQAHYETENLGNGVTLDMVSIPGGTFMMGSPDNEGYSDERPQHRVTVEPFWMGKYPVTQAQWQAVMGNNPSNYKGEQRPVEQISWHDAVEFCQRLSDKTGREYRLASEAEWEYACRAGTTTPFYFGETLTTDLANYNKYRGEATDVGIFPPNAFGLYDMHGNVWEWCADLWHNSYNGAPTDGSAWLAKKSKKRSLANLLSKNHDKRKRVLRGGSFVDYPSSSNRIRLTSDNNGVDFGFRVAVVAWT